MPMKVKLENISLALWDSAESICKKSPEQKDAISAGSILYFLPHPTIPHPPTARALYNKN